MMNEEERRQRLGDLQMQRRIREFGLPKTHFTDHRLADFKIVPETEAAFKLTRNYLCIGEDLKEEIENNDSRHHFLTFVGPCGRGKTHLALAVGIWYIEELGVSAIYYQVPELLTQLRQSFEVNAEFTYGEIMDKCKNADLLILDDLGMQSNTSWAVEQLDSLIDFRYVHERDTIFTTNLKIDELPPRVASRLKEGDVAQLTGCDYREVKAGHRLGQRISK